jgi:hypothetical protein
MTRDELIRRTRQLIAEGERLERQPSLGALQTWLQLSDDLLSGAWGTMDRYHLSWLMVGRPQQIVRGRPMTAPEEAAYVREVASRKTAALRLSLDAVERQGMPFRGETGGMGPGQGMGAVPGRSASADPRRDADTDAADTDAADTDAAHADAADADAADTDAADPEARPKADTEAVSAESGPGPSPDAVDPEARPKVDTDALDADARPVPDGAAGSPAQRPVRPPTGPPRSIPLDAALQRRLDEARRAAGDHADHVMRRAPRPERMRR